MFTAELNKTSRQAPKQLQRWHKTPPLPCFQLTTLWFRSAEDVTLSPTSSLTDWVTISSPSPNPQEEPAVRYLGCHTPQYATVMRVPGLGTELGCRCCWLFLNYAVIWINLHSSGIYSRSSLFSKAPIDSQWTFTLSLLFRLWQYLISVRSTHVTQANKTEGRKKAAWLIHLPWGSETKSWITPIQSNYSPCLEQDMDQAHGARFLQFRDRFFKHLVQTSARSSKYTLNILGAELP